MNTDSVLKTRGITLPTKGHIVKAMVFPVVMYRCESWTIKKAEHQRTDAFELWCWRRLLRVPWTPRRSNQLILKEINPEYSLEGLMLKLKLQSFGHLMWRSDSFEKTLMLGKIEGMRRRGRQRMRWLDGIADPMDMSLSRPWELVMARKAWHAAVHGVSKNRTQLSDWTTTSKDLLKRNILCLPTSYFNSLYFLSSSHILLNFLVCCVSYGLAYQEIKSKQSSPAGGGVSQGLQKLLLCQEDLTSILNSSQNSSLTKSWNGTWRLSVREQRFVYFMLWFPVLCRPRDSLQPLPGCLGEWIQEYAERLSYLISSGMSVMTARLSKCANSFKKEICFSKDSVLWLTPYWPQLWPNMLPKVSDTLLPQLL